MKSIPSEITTVAPVTKFTMANVRKSNITIGANKIIIEVYIYSYWKQNTWAFEWLVASTIRK